MPTESTLPIDNPPTLYPSPSADLKCSLCGLCATSTSTSTLSASTPDRTIGQDVVILSDPVERICGVCVRSQENRERERDLRMMRDPLGLGVYDTPNRSQTQWTDSNDTDNVKDAKEVETTEAGVLEDLHRLSMPESLAQSPEPVPIPRTVVHSQTIQAQSLPSHNIRPWKTTTPTPLSAQSPGATRLENDDVLPNPLIDVAKARMPNIGRGALYPGSIFRGTQTSGRSAYDVEVRLLDVNMPESTLSGYLSISQLTDAHPHLTTFFTGEIIGPKNGFITGSKYGATEHDDMRHWGRFEQFRRPSTRADMIRPELLFREPMPDRNRGEVRGKERDFVFLRIKERFLVPDHTVRDISGASFAGFYYAMVDLAPDVIPEQTSPTIPLKSPTLPTSPTLPRRTSNDVREHRPDLARRRQSSSKFTEPTPTRGEATIRGYYFHSLNQEPFQELFLTHVPNRSSSTMELR